MWAQMITTRIKDGSEAQLAKLFQQLRDAEQPGSGLLRTLALRDQNDPSSPSRRARCRESDDGRGV
jgi:hypothetical protein